MADDALPVSLRAMLRDLENTAADIGGLNPRDKSGQLANALREQIGKLRKLLVRGAPPSAPAVTPSELAGQPCWHWANLAYEWGMETLPAAQRNYRGIHAAAIAAQAQECGSVPRAQLPASSATFTRYVRHYRRANHLPSHRAMRRSADKM